MRSIRRSGVVLLLPVVACAGESGGMVVMVRDSAGVRIVENLAADSASLTWWSMEPSPLTDIGMLDGPEAQTLFRVVDAVRLTGGGIVVANGGTSEIRWYDAAGDWVRSVGGQGGGPGEYQRIASVILLGADSLAVVDGAGGRVTVLDPEGSLVRDFTANSIRASPVHRLPDGRWVATTSLRIGPETVEAGLMRADILYVALAADGSTVLDTIGAYPGSEAYLNVRQSGGQITGIEITTAVPFTRSTTVEVRDDALYVGSQDAPEVLEYGVDGTLRGRIRTGAPTVPVTESMVTEWVDRRVRIAPPERQAGVREGLLALPHGETVPPYGSLKVDRSGNLWVQDYAGLTDAPHWTVYDADGARMARIALPGKFTPYDIGDDWILGRELDDLEIEHVRLYGLRK